MDARWTDPRMVSLPLWLNGDLLTARIQLVQLQDEQLLHGHTNFHACT